METSHGPREGCPDLETIAAYVDGRLEAGPREAAAAHLSTCEDCYEVFAETVRFQKEKGAAERGTVSAVSRPWFRRSTALAGIAASLLAAGLVGIAFLKGGLGAGDGRSPAFRELVKAVGNRRPVEARLTGGFAWGPVPSPKRGVTAQRDADAYLIQGAAGGVMKAMEGRETPEAFGALGTAQLIVGKTDEAVAALEEAVRLSPQDARLLSDLSAVYLERAKTSGRAEDLPKALEAASKAVELEPKLLEARFNRALAFDALHFVREARAAWEEYLKADGGSDWSNEVRRRLAEPLASPGAGLSPAERGQLIASARSGDFRSGKGLVVRSPAETRRLIEEELLPDWSTNGNLKVLRVLVDAHAEATGERQFAEVVSQLEEIAPKPVDGKRRTFVEGHEAYRDAAVLYRAGRVEASVTPFTRAQELLSKVGSPYARWADLHLAIADYQRQRLVPALDRLNRVLDGVRGRNYESLEARVLWMRGLVVATKGDLVSSLNDYQRALVLSRQLGDASDAASLHSLLASSFDALGEGRPAWENRCAAFASLDLLAGPRRLRILEEAARASEREGLSHAALHLLDAAVERSGEGLPVDRALLRLDRALARQRAGFPDSKLEDDLGAARTALAEVQDPSVHARLEILREELEGEILTRTDPGAAAQQLTKALESREASGESFAWAELHLLRGRALLASGRLEGADADFREGIADVEKRLVSQKGHRASYVDRTGELFDEAIRLAVERGNSEGALSLTERHRSRDLLLAGSPPSGSRSGTPLDAASLRAALSSDVALVYYAALPERLLRWVVTSGSVRFTVQPLGASELARRVESYLDALVGGRDPRHSDELAKSLHADLIGDALASLGAGTTLVFIPDAVLWHVPFASLRDPSTARRLIQDAPIGIAPSGTVFLRARDAAPPSHQECRVLIVTPTHDHLVGLPGLPDSRREASAVARLYGQDAILFSGSDATAAAIKERLSSARIFHFAGHAQASTAEPSLSRLILSSRPGGPEQALYARDLAGSSLSGLDLAVLAGCATAAGPSSRSEGPLSLARAFLAGGAASVLGTLWDIDDRDAEKLLVAFHRNLIESHSPLQALRRAQLTASPENRSVWAFEVFGSRSPACPEPSHRKEQKS
jgi:CHAT domain-containing protein